MGHFLHLLGVCPERILSPIEAHHRSTRIMNFAQVVARFAYLTLSAGIVLAEGLIFEIGAA
jgi:hypothetical protein